VAGGAELGVGHPAARHHRAGRRRFAGAAAAPEDEDQDRGSAHG
jgi:hypothetical protein